LPRINYQHSNETMTVSRFRSSYGPYDVIRAELARPVETNSEGTATQSVITFETAEAFEGDQQPVSIVGATLFRQANGHSFTASYDGQRRTLSREKARRQYAAALQQGYSPEIERLF
jgi:hypothetical protein